MAGRIKEYMIKKTEGNRVLSAFMKNTRSRTVLIASGSLVINIAFALYNCVLGIMDGSIWFLNLCVYYAILSGMRFRCVMTERRVRHGNETASEEVAAFFAGIMLIIMSLVLSGVICYSTIAEVAVAHGLIVMIIIAMYTFYKNIIAIRNLIRVRKDGSPLMVTLRDISCADAAVSVLSLQRSMLVSFEGMDAAEMKMMNCVTGAFVCAVVLALGVFLCIRYRKFAVSGR